MPTRNLDPARLKPALLASLVLMLLVAGLAALRFEHERHSVPSPPAQTLKPALTSANDLGLNVELEQNSARITWNPNSSAIAKASSGTLVVSDGRSASETSLSARDLTHGNLIYGPLTNSAMTFQLRVGPITETFSVTLFDRPPKKDLPARQGEAPPTLVPEQARIRDKPLARVEPRAFIAPEARGAKPNARPPGAAPGGPESFPSEPPVPPDLGPAGNSSRAELNQVPLSVNSVRLPAPPAAPQGQANSPPSEQIEYVAPSPLKPVHPTVPANMLRLVSSPVTIRVQVHIDMQGRVVHAEPLTRGSALIDYLSKLCTSVAREWQFLPAKRGNRPVESDTILVFDFDSRGSLQGPSGGN